MRPGQPRTYPQGASIAPGGSEGTQILLVGNRIESLRLLDELLSTAGYSPFLALNDRSLLTSCKEGWPSLVIIDVRIDGVLDGVDLCRRIRSLPESGRPPLLLLSGRAFSDPEIARDTCMVGEFKDSAFVSKVKQTLERSRKLNSEPQGPDRRNLIFDEERRHVIAGGIRVDLTAMELELLLALARARGSVVTRKSLLATARGWTPSTAGRSVDVHLSSIRRKLGEFGDLLETVRGMGYRLRHEEGSAG